jgi:hypothetical protein
MIKRPNRASDVGAMRGFLTVLNGRLTDSCAIRDIDFASIRAAPADCAMLRRTPVEPSRHSVRASNPVHTFL